MYSSKKAIDFLKKDRRLAKIITQVGPYQIKITKNQYQSLVESIITQQLSGSAAKSISNKFHRLYRSSSSTNFPRPINVIKTPDSKLRAAGLSRMKIKYIKELSKQIDSKNLSITDLSNLPNEEVISTLTQIKGIGRWTAEMFLIFSLGRMDVLPVDDLGLQKGIQKLYGMSERPKPKEIEEIAAKWKPYRSIATWYLWKSLKKFDAIG